MKPRGLHRIALVLCAAALLPAFAADFPASAVPDPLKTWVPWVLDDVPEAGCPHLFNEAEPRQCAWPGVLALTAHREGASFSQEWQVYRESWAALPGDERHWPREVEVDGKAAAVIGRDGVPSIRLSPGAHRVEGRFAWSELPESLALPASAALLRLEVGGKTVALPSRDEENRLWLQGRADREAGTGEAAELRLYRKIIDGVPIEAETRLRLEVSGKARELTLGRALLAGWVPKAIVSPLPAALTREGGLKVQARAGTWDITLIARSPGPVRELRLPPLPQGAAALTADEEVWVYQSAPSIRSAAIEGAPAVDPQQTTLPPDWRTLPSYLMRGEEVFAFKEIRRGEGDPAPDRLTLDRRIWLAFDGGAYSVSDRLNGEIGRATRLEMGAPAVLGRVDLDGEDQLITRGSDERAGIEIKRGRVALSADSAVPGAPRRFAAVGWGHDVERLSVDLNLPAGWRLIYAGGADAASGAWLMQWNLLDVFLVLLAALAAGRLWGVKWGLVALFALVLSYQEPGAPTWEWLLLLAAVAIHRALPAGRAKSVMNLLRQAGVVALALMSLAFATEQIRTALYPVLEARGGASFGGAPSLPAPDDIQQVETLQYLPPPINPQEMVREENASSLKSLVRPRAAAPAAKPAPTKQRAYQALDPEAKVQTGPGLPDWRWHNHPLRWNGPVDAGRSLDLWLLSPSANRAVVLLRLALLVLLLAGFAGFLPPGARAGQGRVRFGRKQVTSSAAAVLAMAALAGALGFSPPANAALPGPEQLDALREKLTRPAECLPECADIARLSVHISGGSLRLGLDVAAARDVALPLPGGAKHWLPNEARLDGKLAYVRRAAENGESDGGSAWLLVPAGGHRVELVGALPAPDVVQLPLPLKPRRVEVHAEGWDVDGLSEESGVADTLQLTRRVKERAASGGKDTGATLPPFLIVERRLVLDLLWRVETTVRRDSPAGVPAVVQIPLLPGESVTSPGILVKDGKALVNLGPQAESVSWSSSLAPHENLSLAAAETADWAEHWTIAASALWHIETEGIPPVAAGEEADLAFRPWPGETLKLSITRPQPVPGQTLTIDQSTLTVAAGARSSDYRLNLVLRGSRGVDHALKLPAGAILQRVAINGETRPIRADGEGRLTLPLSPGRQNVEVSWRLEQEMTMRYATHPVDLGEASVNHRLQLTLPQDRWLLAAGGPGLGPAILFWGKLLALIAVALLIGRVSARRSGGPMRHAWQWALLALGLTQSPWWAVALIVGWFFALAWRERQGAAPVMADADARRAAWAHWPFNLRQIFFILLTLSMLGVLFFAVADGLLGAPDMQVAGNGSNAFALNWYLDRADSTPPAAWALTLPILVYRGLMLLWALWLAASLLAWLKWGWNAFIAGGLWRRRAKISS